MTVLFKFKSHVPAQERDALGHEIYQKFGVSAVQFFPHSQSSELGDIFQLDIPESDSVLVLDELSKNQSVEYAEAPPERHLVP